MDDRSPNGAVIPSRRRRVKTRVKKQRLSAGENGPDGVVTAPAAPTGTIQSEENDIGCRRQQPKRCLDSSNGGGEHTSKYGNRN